jgi:hypothetical protein
MATTGTPNVNKPTDLKKKEADVNRKLQVYGIISAFQNGKVPSVCHHQYHRDLNLLVTAY